MSGLILERVVEGDWDRLQRMFDALVASLGVIAQMPVFIGTGDPNGVVEASPPAMYLNYSGGASTTVYVKESGSATDTGWIGK